MGPSQLKRLKASLHEHGLTGPQKSKQQKRKQQDRRQSGDTAAIQRLQRQETLDRIRESFNPFDVKELSRPRKFDVTTRDGVQGRRSAGIGGRPGATKSVGEAARKSQLLPEMQQRGRTGGIIDRRIGERDPTLTPGERAMQRFTRESQNKRSAAVFDLENSDDEGLTHGGRAIGLDLGDDVNDDFELQNGDMSEDDSVTDSDGETSSKKRKLVQLSDGLLEGGHLGGQGRKKTKKEVMEEVIAKSKLHRYENQQAKEEDDDLREKIDKELPGLLDLLSGRRKPIPKAPTGGDPLAIHPDRLAMMDGGVRAGTYDSRLKVLAQDQRAAPTERTKTDEELAEEAASRNAELEARRLRRMRGEPDSESEEEPERHTNGDTADADFGYDDAMDFGLQDTQQDTNLALLDEEDDFELDDDLVASEASVADSMSGDESGDEEAHDETIADTKDAFVQDLLTKDESERWRFMRQQSDSNEEASRVSADAATCPENLEALLQLVNGKAYNKINVTIQRVRVLYHTQLHAENKAKLSNFSATLVEYISYLAKEKAPTEIIESVIRHVHSLSRTFAETIANAFRSQLQEAQQQTGPTGGDLAILTAIGSIYPTSDHFHQVVTPAITLMAKWLGLSSPRNSKDSIRGAYLVALIIRYQGLAARYVPEAVRYTILCLKMTNEHSLINTHVENLIRMAELWKQKSAFIEIFVPHCEEVLQSIRQPKSLRRLQIMLNQAELIRNPLELHYHKPRPIPSKIPKFEENFDPNKHYDPDKDRAEASKLRAEFKREKKGAMRELRKDANFIARQQLQQKKEADQAYEEKFRKLIASIQHEEGQEANQYEREKEARKKRR